MASDLQKEIDERERERGNEEFNGGDYKDD